jgi:serine phosphatase RsbU (regulator of sigma subunit)
MRNFLLQLFRSSLIGICILFGTISLSSAQSPKIDSLKKLIEVVNDTQRVNILNDLADLLIYTNPAQSKEYTEKASKIAKANQFKKGEIFVNIGFARYYWLEGNDIQGLDYAFKALKMAESIEDKSAIGRSFSIIAIIYDSQQNYNQAIEYNEKALKIYQQLQDEKLGITINNMGVIYRNKKEYDKALNYYFQAIKISKNTSLSSLCMTNIAFIYVQQKKYQQAIQYANQGIEIAQKANNIRTVLRAYNILATVYKNQNQLSRAEEFGLKSLQMAQKMTIRLEVQEASQTLAEIYKAQQNYQKAYQYQSLFIAVKDSIQNETTAKKMGSIRTSYEVSKKQAEIDLLNKDKRIQALINYSLVGGLGLIVLLAFILYRNNRLKQKSNLILKRKNIAIEQQQKEILVQNEELQQRQDEIMTQRDYIEERNSELELKNQEIKNNIKVALNIQEAILPNTLLQQLLPNNFLLYLPKDVVSGDFFWIAEMENKIYLAVGDCTGHGVSGAFMTLIGHSLLDKIVKAQKITSPAEVLDALHNEVVGLLAQDITGNNSGMDMAFLILEKTNQQDKTQITFSGAKRPLYYIDAEAPTVVQELEADRKSIGGIQSKHIQFTNQTLVLPKRSWIYLSSDGFTDQNNFKRKRFGVKNFKQIVLQSLPEVPATQKQILSDTLQNHMKDTELRDDILVLGIQL